MFVRVRDLPIFVLPWILHSWRWGEADHAMHRNLRKRKSWKLMAHLIIPKALQKWKKLPPEKGTFSFIFVGFPIFVLIYFPLRVTLSPSKYIIFRSSSSDSSAESGEWALSRKRRRADSDSSPERNPRQRYRGVYRDRKDDSKSSKSSRSRRKSQERNDRSSPTRDRNEAKDFQRLMDLEKQRWQ